MVLLSSKVLSFMFLTNSRCTDRFDDSTILACVFEGGERFFVAALLRFLSGFTVLPLLRSGSRTKVAVSPPGAGLSTCIPVSSSSSTASPPHSQSESSRARFFGEIEGGFPDGRGKNTSRRVSFAERNKLFPVDVGFIGDDESDDGADEWLLAT